MSTFCREWAKMVENSTGTRKRVMPTSKTFQDFISIKQTDLYCK